MNLPAAQPVLVRPSRAVFARRRLMIAGAAVVVLLGGGMGWAALSGGDESDPPADAPVAGAGQVCTAPVLPDPPELAPEPEVDSTTTTPRHIDTAREPIVGYVESVREPHPISPGLQPYNYGVVNAPTPELLDEQGVRMFVADWDQQTYDHPIAQAQYALKDLESYRLTGAQSHLDSAIVNAERIIERRHEIDGAWYFPYDFDFDLYRNDRGVLEAPWTSGMASGQALSTFVRLYEVTGADHWRQAAEGAFAAFTQAPDGQGYFSAFVDDNEWLWLEEYSRYPQMASERVLNGHIWSMYGIWDYWMMHDYDHPQAESLWRGALHTVEQSAGSLFRNLEGASHYSLWQHQLAPTYHRYHQEQFLMLYRMSHDPVWALHAFDYRSDWPNYRQAGGRAVITPAARVAHRLDDRATHIKDRPMTIQESRTVELDQAVEVDWDRRGQIPGGPRVFRVSEGELTGWWIPEDPAQAWVLGFVEEHRYAPELALCVDAPHQVTLYRYDPRGEQIEVRQVLLDPSTELVSDRSAYTQARVSYHLTSPEFRGWWLPADDAVLIRAGAAAKIPG